MQYKRKYYFMRFPLIIVLSLLLSVICKNATCGSIKGHVSEQITGDPLSGAIIQFESTNFYTVSDLNGFFRIKNIPDGTYTVLIYYVSYKTFTRSITIKNNEEVIIEAQLEPANVDQLKEIIVIGKNNRSSERRARNLEQSASQIMNVLSSQAIKISPDLTVANLVQRVSGVSIERDNSGEGEYAILRGMDKRYNYTLLNGVKIPGPDKANRYIPLDIFPSELLERLEVYKTLTPSMEGDAVGGVVNMVMKDAPDTLSVTANISTGYSQIFFNRDFIGFKHQEINEKSPYEIHPNQYNAKPSDFSTAPVNYLIRSPMPDLLAGFSAGNRFLKNKLGVLLAATFQNTYRGNNSLFFESNVVDTLKGVTLTSMRKRNYSEQELRYAFYSKIDYKIKRSDKIQWSNSFFNLSEFQVRDTKSTFLTIGGYDPDNGNAALEYSTRARTTKQNIYNSTLQGFHHLSNDLKLNWSAVYSVAKGDQPDNATVILNGEEKNFLSKKTTVDNASRRWERNSDRDLAGYANLSYSKSIAGLPVEWTIGGLYRDKQRANFFNEYEFRPENAYALFGKDFNDYSQVQWIVENARGSVGTSLNYKAFEKIASEYVKFNSHSTWVEITGGVRIESTNQGYALDYPIGESYANGKQRYTDLLPSLNLKFMPAEKINLRASYFRSVNRPGFFEIVPYTIVNEDYVERGNPALKHAVADDIDFRFESFPKPAAQIMAGLFFKHIQNPIEYILKSDSLRGQDIYYTPGNFGNAINYGAEIDFIKYFSRIGIKANYTYTHSHITTTKSKRIRDQNGNLETISVNETRPLYGQSAHIANVSVLYKDGKKGWDAQLAAQYTGERINAVSQFVDNDLWQKAFVQMDASIEKKFKRGLVIFAKLNNLLNTPMMVYIKNASSKNAGVPVQSIRGKTLIIQNYYQRSYYLGIRYTF